MQKRIFILSTLVFLLVAALTQADELRIRPHRLNPNGKRAVMKAEVWTEDTKAIDTANITLNGVAATRTHVTPKKVIAFFSKKEVVATLGEVQAGQTYTLSLGYSANAQPSNLTGEIKIVGRKKDKP